MDIDRHYKCIGAKMCKFVYGLENYLKKIGQIEMKMNNFFMKIEIKMHAIEFHYSNFLHSFLLLLCSLITTRTIHLISFSCLRM